MNTPIKVQPLVDHIRVVAVEHEVESVCLHVLDDPRFIVWSGSGALGKHHYGTGGLVRHTCEVLDLCLLNASQQGRFGNKAVDLKVLVAAAIFHDCGKMWDYACAESPVWTNVRHKSMVGHLSRSYAEWMIASAKAELCENFRMEVGHCILSHHQRKEWGSPVEPTTPEAWILHLSDQLSARLNDVDTFVRKA